MKQYILKYSFILLIGLLIQWWIFDFSELPIPQRIPSTPIRIDGLVLVCYIIMILICFEKGLLKTQPSKGILSLTLLGMFMCFIAETVFQIIRIPTLGTPSLTERIYYLIYGTIGISIFALVFSFLIAFQLKKKNSFQLLLFIAAFLCIIYIWKSFF